MTATTSSSDAGATIRATSTFAADQISSLWSLRVAGIVVHRIGTDDREQHVLQPLHVGLGDLEGELRLHHCLP